MALPAHRAVRVLPYGTVRPPELAWHCARAVHSIISATNRTVHPIEPSRHGWTDYLLEPARPCALGARPKLDHLPARTGMAWCAGIPVCPESGHLSIRTDMAWYAGSLDRAILPEPDCQSTHMERNGEQAVTSMPSTPNRAVGLPEPASNGALAVPAMPSAPNQTVRMLEPVRQCVKAVPVVPFTPTRPYILPNPYGTVCRHGHTPARTRTAWCAGIPSRSKPVRPSVQTNKARCVGSPVCPKLERLLT